jgi:hypothetical protein
LSGPTCRYTILYTEQIWLGSFACLCETLRVMSNTINDDDQSSFFICVIFMTYFRIRCHLIHCPFIRITSLHWTSSNPPSPGRRFICSKDIISTSKVPYRDLFKNSCSALSASCSLKRFWLSCACRCWAIACACSAEIAGPLLLLALALPEPGYVGACGMGACDMDVCKYGC